MRTLAILAGLASAALLSACSPASVSADDEKSLRAEAAREVKPSEEKLAPVTDAEGNAVDPQLAEAVRQKMEEDQAALDEASSDDPSAPTDQGVPASDDET